MSPSRYCFAKSLFSPTYDETILLIWRVSNITPSPMPSTPALFEMTVRSFTPDFATASISASGIPHSPKPPDINVMPSLSNPSRAAVAWGYTLLTMARLYLSLHHVTMR